MIPGLVRSGLLFDLGDRHDCFIIVGREAVVVVFSMDGSRIANRPFAETDSVPSLRVVNVGAPHAVTGARVVITSQN